jgi:hypothetical protein
MNEKVSPDMLPPGVAADLRNVLLDETPGTVVKRLGSRAVAALPSGLPPRDTYVFTKTDGTAYQLVSDGVSLYYTTDPSDATLYVLLKTGLNTDGFMTFETAGGRVWMGNGIDPDMSWDGTTLLVYDRTYTSTSNLTTVDTTHFTHAGLTSSDDYWNGMKLVFTVGANVGTVVTVTDYVEATKTVTFTPAVAGIAATDRFIVGVLIPRGSARRFWDGHLFIGCTADNDAELRFSEISDPDTGELITIDNPRAWPAANELALNVLDQERLWGITPILRDRIMVHKASGLWRLERDPLVRYRLELVSRAVGSRFPDTWAEKSNLLYFLGQDKDGFPEIYKTDMVDVTLVDPDGGVEPTLRDLQQPNALQMTRVFSAPADFDAGTLSSMIETEAGSLAIGGFHTAAQWQGDNLVSGGNIDVESTPGKAAVLGIPSWDTRYEADALPQNATPAWTVVQGAGIAASVAAGVLTITNNATGFEGYTAALSGRLNSTKDAFMVVKFKLKSGANMGVSSFFLANGAYKARACFRSNSTTYTGSETPNFNGSAIAVVSADVYHTANILLKSNGTSKLWLDGVLISSAAPTASTDNLVEFDLGSATTATVSHEVYLDSFYFHADFKGDQLSSFGGKISPTSLPDTLPASGNIVMLNDLTRTPDALLRVFQSSTLNGGTVGLESWTSDTTDFSTGNDAAGYLAVANGAVPTSATKRAQRIRATLTRADVANAPEVAALYSGTLWLSPAVQLGSTISAWRTFLSTLTTPAGVSQSIKIRRATVAGTPIESDYGAWVAVVNGNNIGTVLTDATPPTSRWVQLKVEQGPSSAGLLPTVDAAVVNWTQGAAGNLPVRALVHKKRYLLVAATSLAAANDIVIVCDRNDQWTKFTGLSLNALVHYKSNLYGLDAAAATQRLMDIAGLYNDDGVAIDAYLITREETFEAGHLRKNYRWSYLHGDRADAAWTLTTSYLRNGESAFTGSGAFSMDTVGSDVRQNFPVATVGKRIQRKYANAVLDENMAFMGETFFFDIRPVQP